MPDKYKIDQVEADGYNYVKMLPDKNSHVCNFAIPLKGGHVINGCVRMIPCEDGFYVKLFNVTEKV